MTKVGEAIRKRAFVFSGDRSTRAFHGFLRTV
jgi:hypothetical protein